MMKTLHALALAASALSPVAVLVAPAPAVAAMPVFDATNYAQNLLQAARALEQINQQVQSLQNEAAMLQNMAKNLQRIDFPQLTQLNNSLARIDQLMGKARGIDFKVDSLDRQFQTLFPGAVDRATRSDQRVADARTRLDSAMAGFRHSMAVQAEVVSNIGEDAGLLDELVARSQGAEGALQAQQATNQLLALSAKQQFQLQDLLAAEFRSAGMERARRVQAEAEAEAATTRFLGTGKAYSSTRD